jgi:hypothetical protein
MYASVNACHGAIQKITVPKGRIARIEREAQ